MFKIKAFDGNTRMPTQDLLQAVNDALAQGETEFHIEAAGQHDIGGPLWHPEGKPLKFFVTNPGQRVGSMCMEGTEIIVDGPAPADVGWLNAGGRVIVRGDGGDTSAHCAASGTVYIGGRVGTRSGSMMKHDPLYAPPEFWVLKSCGSFSFEFMSGGIAVVCGHDSEDLESVLGDRACVGMVGGRLYFRGRAAGLSAKDVKVTPLDEADIAYLSGNMDDFLGGIDRPELKDALTVWNEWHKVVPLTYDERPKKVNTDIRAFRTTLPRFGYAQALDTSEMLVRRRVSATYKDLPGGQLLGPTFDYTHRLLDTSLGVTDESGEVDDEADPTDPAADAPVAMPRVTDLLGQEGLIEAAPADDGAEPFDITRAPVSYPVDRSTRLQTLARGDEGYLLALGYSTQRGYARSHPFVGEIRFGDVEVIFEAPELGFELSLGTVQVTECQSVNQFKGSATTPPQFTRGYGLVFGQCERKALSMALVERALRWKELGEEPGAPAQDEEFVLSHCDNVQATGFVEHLKLPHYVDFQAELDLVRRMRAEQAAERPADGIKEAAE